MIRFGLQKKAKRQGLIGINARNCNYIAPLNERRLLPLVDSKILTKTAVRKVGVPTPELIGVIETQFAVRRLDAIIGDRTDFVVKPARGSQGNGILVINGKTPMGGWRRGNGKPITRERLDYHIRNIVSGMYSKSSLGDYAMVEERIIFASTFDEVAFFGVPDIRIIVYRGVPCMAMVRLPTSESDGKANLHKGGVGAGIDMATGKTKNGVHKNRLVDRHPDSFALLAGIQIPNWREMLLMSSRCYDAIPLGYLGVDIVIDARKGPLLLELNARPGLAVQMANQQGIRAVVDRIPPDALDSPDIEKRAFAFCPNPPTD